MSAYRVPARVAHVVGTSGDDPSVFLMRLPDGPPMVLHGPAAMIWLLAAHGEVDVAAAVGACVGLDRETVADDVIHFLHDLVARDLLAGDASLVDGHSP